MRCSMPRQARIAPGEIIYHALYRASAITHSRFAPSFVRGVVAPSDDPRADPADYNRLLLLYREGPVIPTGLRVGPGQLLARVKELGDMRSYRSIHLKP